MASRPRNTHLPMNGAWDRFFACGRPYRADMVDPTKPVCGKCASHVTRAVKAEVIPILEGKEIPKQGRL